jgi:hypothetical protein
VAAPKPDRAPPGLPAVHQARADRERGRYSRGSPAVWLGIVVCLVAIVVAYRFVEERQLGAAKEVLLAKERAVRTTVGDGAWFPLRDGVEKVVLEAAAKDEPDFVDPGLARWDFRALPGLYLRMRVADAKDVASLRHAASFSQRDGFVGCFLREPNPAAARGDADAGAFAEQPWNWRKAYEATRTLTDDWTGEVNASDDPLRLKVFQEQYDRAMKTEIPAAIDLIKRAQFFLFILDEDSPDIHPAEAGAPVTEADLQRAPHVARIHMIDLRTHTEVLRVKRSADASFVFAGEGRVSDPETLDAMKRQVQNCALAKEVDRAISAASGK